MLYNHLKFVNDDYCKWCYNEGRFLDKSIPNFNALEKAE